MNYTPEEWMKKLERSLDVRAPGTRPVLVRPARTVVEDEEYEVIQEAKPRKAKSMAKKTSKKRAAKKTGKKRRKGAKKSPVASAMRVAVKASERRIMAQWHEKTAKLNAECAYALDRLKKTAKAASAVKKLRVL